MRPFRHIYVHIPFCEVICHYCHFYTARAKEAPYPEFFRALERERELWEHQLAPSLDAIYFGGGTPGASPPEFLASFLATFAPKISPATEITLETNPSNVSAEAVAAWRSAGINRISLGMQSLDDRLLKKLGRVHSAAEALQAARTCVKVIPNVCCDLMYGVPEQSESQPKEHALTLAGLGAQQISAYHLTLEENHFLHARLPSDSLAWKQIAGIRAALEPLGFLHYEVASFALPGKESRNNKNYWSGGPYLALGPSAHGFDGEMSRWRNVSDWREYIRRLEENELPISARETLTPEQRRIEVIFTSLRTAEGLDLAKFQKQFGQDLANTHQGWLRRWEQEGLARLANGSLVLTFEGQMLADEIAKALI